MLHLLLSWYKFNSQAVVLSICDAFNAQQIFSNFINVTSLDGLDRAILSVTLVSFHNGYGALDQISSVCCSELGAALVVL